MAPGVVGSDGFAGSAPITGDDRIYVAGHRGLAGSAIMRRLTEAGYEHLLTRPSSELDLRDRGAVEAFFDAQRPDIVFLAAAKVGGILANARYGGDFLRDNLLIQTHVIDAAYRYGARKLIFLGSSCIYPKHAPQPMMEDVLLTGPLEPTNQPYALAKIAGVEMCRTYRAQYGFDAVAVMPSNLYGPGDNFDLENAHVLPALMRRLHEAKHRGDDHIEVWGSGTPRREFLHADDLAEALLFLAHQRTVPPIINIGLGVDVTIRQLAEMLADVVGFTGRLVQDTSKPDGTPRKLLDIRRLQRLGWSPARPLREGLAQTYNWFTASLQDRPAAVRV